MPNVNWKYFEQLPGSADYNFEMLCRSLIRRHYGRFGQFIALANQPGVEFHLKLHSNCLLGDKGRWFGWQCRWFEVPKGKSIGTTRRNKIEQSLRKTENVLPDITDWVLWTRHTLTKEDQKWFYSLKTKYRLDLWTISEVEDLLCGDAEILRSSYFGELILTPDALNRLHAISIERIKKRWLPEAHQIVNAERTIRRMLGESQSWNYLNTLSKALSFANNFVKANMVGVPSTLSEDIKEFIDETDKMIASLSDVIKLLKRGDLDLLRQCLNIRTKTISNKLAILPRKLRMLRNITSLDVTNGVADLRASQKILDKVDSYLGTRLIGVLADAGGGKTQLAAQLTAAMDDRPAGVLLYGQDFHAGNDLNKLANKIVIPGNGNPVPSMEALIAAVDAAGQRAQQRLPIVIDGLNEAEDPRNWKGHLASLNKILNHYPYVLVVCTVRTGSRLLPDQLRWYHDSEASERRRSFADDALPDDVHCLEIPNFGIDTEDAIRRYFQYFKINPGDAAIPIELLSHPLTLRLFCEVTNSERKNEVGIEAMPGSLTALFDRYLRQAAELIAQFSTAGRRYYQQDVRQVFDKIGFELWEKKSRELNENKFRNLLGDDKRTWDQSFTRALEQEGLILRTHGDNSGSLNVMIVYDALAGHLIANSILSKHGQDGFATWLKEPTTMAALMSSTIDSHPLAGDIFRAFVGLVPRRLNQQFWKLIDEPLQNSALYRASELEGSYLDNETVQEIVKIVTQTPTNTRDILNRLFNLRSTPAHPLNAKFLDSVLRSMSVANRDLRWTEWIRHNREKLLADIETLGKKWRNREARLPDDGLRAEWVKWMLTSTIRILRDKATHTLYWFGRQNPASLFDMAIEAFSINDPYIPERMLAASYGVAMALHGNSNNLNFRNETLPNFALKLFQLMFAKEAPYSTTHALIKDFARHIVQLALLYNKTLLTTSQCKRIAPPFRDGGIQKWGRLKGFGTDLEFNFSGPLHMDFANYTLNTLVPQRRNYNFKDKNYIEIVENVYWRLDQLGYSFDAFEKIDKQISSEHWGGRSESNEGRVDRYGKKYSWIAFYELFGFRHDKGLLKAKYYDEEERPSEVDIDPSFPEEPHAIQVVTEDWLGNRKLSLPSWIDHGGQPDIKKYLVVNELNDAQCPWVLLDGFIVQEDKKHKRALFTFPRGLLVSKRNSREIRQLLSKQKLDRYRLPDIPTDHYTFAGEIPWCETFPFNELDDLTFQVKELIKKIPNTVIKFYRSGKEMNEKESTTFIIKLRSLLEVHKKEEILELLKEEQITFREVKSWSETKEPITKTLKVLLPVRENNWESYHSGINPGQNVIVPAREIAGMFSLSLRPPSWDMYDVKNNLASISIQWGNTWATGHNLCYLRKDILDQFLKEKKMEFIWAVWGEREIKMESEELQNQRGKNKKWRKDFQQIYHYRNGHILLK